HNEAGALLDVRDDIGFTAGEGGDLATLINQGTVRKSAGNGLSEIGIAFNLEGGTVEVESGTLRLSRGGTSSGGTLTVNGGAALELGTGTYETRLAGTYSG